MSALRCLSCEQVNRVGKPFCERCFSTLNVKLCEDCGAINGSSAQRCYKCHAQFPTEPAIDQLKSVQPALGPLHSSVPAVTERRLFVSGGNRSPARRVRPFWTIVASLLLAAMAGLAYYVYREPTLVPYAADIVRRSLVEADQQSIAVSGVIVAADVDRADASFGGATRPAPPVAEDAQQLPMEQPPEQPDVSQPKAAAQRKPCEELRSEIEAKLKFRGVIRYSLDVVSPTDVKDGKVVGSCDGGTRKIVYKRPGASKHANVEHNAQRTEQQSGYFDPSN